MSSYLSIYLLSFGLGAVGSLLGAVGGIVLVSYGWSIRRAALHRRTPTVEKVLKAHPGLVEASGIAAGPYTTTSPITETACFAYRAVAWRERHSGGESSFELVVEEKLHVPFYLDDGTGMLLIDPAGANLDLRHDFRHEFKDVSLLKDNLALKNLDDFLQRHSVSAAGSRLRVEEFCIKPKTQLFVRGTLAPNPGLAVGPRDPLPTEVPVLPAGHGLTSLSAEVAAPKVDQPENGNDSDTSQARPESGPKALSPTDLMAALNEVVDLTGTLPLPGSSTHMTQQGKIAAALQRAGILMPDIRSLMLEGESAADRPAIPADGEESAAGNGLPSAASNAASHQEFDLKPSLVIMKGTAPFDFVISWRGKSIHSASVSWKVRFLPWAGAGLTLFSLFFFVRQLGWL